MSGRTAILVPSGDRLTAAGERRTRVGGADMRFESVRRALDRTHGCLYVESMCERNRVCRERCAATGAPRAADPVWYYDSTYCPDHADRIAERLIASGVSTVVCSSINVYRYVVHLAAYRQLRVAFDMHNVESMLYGDIHGAIPPGARYERVVSPEHVARIRAAEAAAVEAADEIWVCSADDQVLVRQTYAVPADKVVRLVPDVVDVPSSAPRADEPVRAVFTARLDYYPNILAAQVLLRDIAPLLAPLPVVVAGAQPDVSLRELDRPPNATVVADPVSIADVTRGGVMVVPLTLGGGSRFKIIEAFAAGVPVVSTRKGAEGLTAIPGTHFLSAESPAEMAAGVRRLRADHGLRATMVRTAWELARERYSLDALTRRLATLPWPSSRSLPSK